MLPLSIRFFFLIAGVFGAGAVLAAAYASHGLDGQAQKWAETAAFFALIHATTLFMTAHFLQLQFETHKTSSKRHLIAGYCWVGGLFLFSANLFIISIIGKYAGSFLTPLGGILFAIGWLSVTTMAYKKIR